jgi:hypothetical protein
VLSDCIHEKHLVAGDFFKGRINMDSIETKFRLMKEMNWDYQKEWLYWKMKDIEIRKFRAELIEFDLERATSLYDQYRGKGRKGISVTC